MHRFFTERTNLRPGSSVKLPEDEANHIRTSLRLQKGDKVILFNGETAFTAELGLVTRKVVMANVIEQISGEKASAAPAAQQVEIVLAMSLIRVQNFELVLQKATELGVSKIIPINADYSQIKNKVAKAKYERWGKIILEACKQAERIDIPEILEIMTPSELVKHYPSSEYTGLMFTLQRQNTAEGIEFETLQGVNFGGEKPILIAVGPEGGFSPSEHILFADNNFSLIEILEGRILRAETAAIAALTLIQNQS